MTFQTYYKKLLAKESGAEGYRGWSKTTFTLFGTFSLVMLTFITGLVWESTGSGLSLVMRQDSPKLIDHILFFGERMLEVDPSTTPRVSYEAGYEANFDLNPSHNVAQTGEGVKKRAADQLPAELNDSAENETDRSHPGSHPPRSNPDMTTNSSENASEMQPSPSTVTTQRSKKIPGSTIPLITGDEPSNTDELKGSSSKNVVCDLARGSWVKDEKRPFYSGAQCKAYLAKDFSCRLTNRPDFEYEKLRWQPENCDLPSFTGDGFLHRLQNKVVAFVGDSLGYQQFQSLMCMITEGKDKKSVEDVKRLWGKTLKGAYRFRKTNTTILYHWSASLCQIQEGHPKEEPGYFAMHLDRPADFLKNFFRMIDVLVLNTGHHWNRQKFQTNKWHQYVDGKPLEDQELVPLSHSLNLTVHKVVNWLDEKLAEATHNPAVFFRTLSPRHFKNGDWNSGGSCDRPSLRDDKMVNSTGLVSKEPITEQLAELAVKGTRVNLLDITYLSMLREEGHISKYGMKRNSTFQDCLHWCLPGVPDVWNELLYANLLNNPGLSPLSHNHH